MFALDRVHRHLLKCSTAHTVAGRHSPHSCWPQLACHVFIFLFPVKLSSALKLLKIYFIYYCYRRHCYYYYFCFVFVFTYSVYILSTPPLPPSSPHLPFPSPLSRLGLPGYPPPTRAHQVSVISPEILIWCWCPTSITQSEGRRNYVTANPEGKCSPCPPSIIV